MIQIFKSRVKIQLDIKERLPYSQFPKKKKELNYYFNYSFSNIRTQSGYIYTIYLYFEPMKHNFFSMFLHKVLNFGHFAPDL